MVIALSLLCAQLNAQSIRKSIRSGNWMNRNTWDCDCVPMINDDVMVVSGHTVTYRVARLVNHLTIENGGTLTDNGAAIIITGDLLVNGTYSGSGMINLTGEDTSIDGSGIISNRAGIWITGNKRILSTAMITVNSGSMLIQGAYSVSNYGRITVGGNINGTEAGSTWKNEINATLNIGGSAGVPLLAMGILDASAAGNTINYYGTYAHSLKLPVLVNGYSTYHHLIISGTNTKTMPNGDVAINGNLTINSTFSGSGTNKKLYVRGHWINNGNYTEGTGGATVTFDGTGDQFISRATTENMNVVVINKSSGNVILTTNLIAERGLTMLAGDIDVNEFTLTLGLNPTTTGVLSWTSGTIIGKFERWIAQTGVPIVFPIGTVSHYRPVSVQFNSLTPGSLTAEFIDSYPGNNGMPLAEDGVTLYNTFHEGYWSMTASNSLDTLNFDIDLTGNGFTGFSINDNTRLLSRTSAINPWSLSGSHLARAGNTIRRTNLTELSSHYCFGVDVNCSAPVTSVISGITEVCTNATGVIYSVINDSASTYSWTVTGGDIISGNGTNSIMVNWGNNGMTGEVAVVEKNTCTVAEEVSILINIHPQPANTITGKINVPENDVTPETYSIAAAANYNYTWSVIGGTIISGQGTNEITVGWGASGMGSVCVLSNHSPELPAVSCGQSEPYCIDIAIYKVINSIRSGTWNSILNWDCSCIPSAMDNVTIKNTHTISMSGGNVVIQHVNINAGGAINTNSNTLTITGDLAVQGILRGSGNVFLNGSNTLLDGVGLITSTGLLSITGNKDIPATTILTKTAGDFFIGAGAIVTNHGTITLEGSVIGEDGNSQWINAGHSTLNVAGEMLTTGKLFTSADENTMHYFGSSPQNLTVPQAQQYEHLILSNVGTKTAPTGTIKISGDFINDGSFLNNNGTIYFNGNSEVSGSGTITFHHLHLQSGSLLKFPGSTVNVAGDITFDSGSTFDPSSGMVSLTGVTTQQVNVNGAEFYTLMVNKSGGTVDLNSSLPILHLLNLQSATVFNSNGHLVIQSNGNTTDLDASIGPIPSGASINGNVQVQRYLQAIGNKHRYISSPVIGTIPESQLADDFKIRKESILYYQESVEGHSNNGWIPHSLSSPMNSGKGYIAWMFDGGLTIKLDVEGSIHQGSVEMPVTFTSTAAGVDYDGWNLVGNPYPSAIQWSGDAAAWAKSADLSPVIYVPDMESNVFRLFNYADGSGDLAAGIIAMGQSFWVKANQEFPELVIHEIAKINTTNGRFYRSTLKDANQLKIKLSNNAISDEVYFKIRPDASADFDPQYDAYKLKNERINIYFIDTADRLLAMYTISELLEIDRVKIGLEVDQPGSYQLSFSGIGKPDEGNWFLVDCLEGKHLQISNESSYQFEVGVPNNSINERFYLTRSLDYHPESKGRSIAVYPNPINDMLYVNLPESFRSKVSLFDAMGKLCWSGYGNSLLMIDMQTYSDGIYFLRIEVFDKVETVKLKKK